MEELTLFERYPIFQTLSYVITVIIGGVGYKYLTLILSHKKDTNKANSDYNQLLITNLQNRIESLSLTVDNFDKERKEIHQRELARERELAETKAEVRVLIEKVKYLEERLDIEKKINLEYRKKYGKIDV